MDNQCQKQIVTVDYFRLDEYVGWLKKSCLGSCIPSYSCSGVSPACCWGWAWFSYQCSAPSVSNYLESLVQIDYICAKVIDMSITWE